MDTAILNKFAKVYIINFWIASNLFIVPIIPLLNYSITEGEEIITIIGINYVVPKRAVHSNEVYVQFCDPTIYDNDNSNVLLL